MRRAAVLLVLALGVVACRRGSAGPERLRLQLDWVPEPEFGGIFAARDRGFFRDEGLEVEVLRGSAGVATPQLVASGQVELGVMAAEQLLAVRARGGPLVAIYATFQTNPLAIMVHDGNAARSLADVWRGTGPVAVEPGQAFVRFLGVRYGAVPRLVPYQGALATFEADPALAQQCYLTAEPVQMALRRKAVRAFPVAESGFDPYNGVIATSESVLASRGDAVRRFVRALRRGWAVYLADPAAFNPAIARENPAMSREAMDLAARRQAPLVESEVTRRLGLGAMDAARWATLGRQLLELGVLDRAPDAERCFVNP
jgi:NitT/TauT family transport system substrate-binding protein